MTYIEHCAVDIPDLDCETSRVAHTKHLLSEVLNGPQYKCQSDQAASVAMRGLASSPLINLIAPKTARYSQTALPLL